MFKISSILVTSQITFRYSFIASIVKIYSSCHTYYRFSVMMVLLLPERIIEKDKTKDKLRRCMCKNLTRLTFHTIRTPTLAISQL